MSILLDRTSLYGNAESFITSLCDGTYRGLEGAYIVEDFEPEKHVPELEKLLEGVARAQLKKVVEWLEEFDREHHSENCGKLFCPACEDIIWQVLKKEASIE